jgi:Amt family ammonium transporter
MNCSGYPYMPCSEMSRPACSSSRLTRRPYVCLMSQKVPKLASYNAVGKGGLFYTGSFHQFFAQVLGVASAFAYVFVLSFATFYAIKKVYGMRVSSEEEDAGLDISEHGMYGYPEQFIPAPELIGYSAPSALGSPPARVATTTREVPA